MIVLLNSQLKVALGHACPLSCGHQAFLIHPSCTPSLPAAHSGAACSPLLAHLPPPLLPSQLPCHLISPVGSQFSLPTPSSWSNSALPSAPSSQTCYQAAFAEPNPVRASEQKGLLLNRPYSPEKEAMLINTTASLWAPPGVLEIRISEEADSRQGPPRVGATLSTLSAQRRTWPLFQNLSIK